MIWIAWFIYGFLWLRMLVSLTNLFTRQWLKNSGEVNYFTTAVESPFISILIPVRNEEKNIGSLLGDLIVQDYERYEIVVYDDNSDDSTGNIVKGYMNTDSRIKMISGSSLPPGWIGKTYACHQLSLAASGDYLLFMDADVRVKPSLLRNSMVHMYKFNLSLLSLFPRQITISTGEKITVPLMNWILLGLLPLILTRRSKLASFSAANGQFMLFRADIYHKYGFHKMVKGKMVEDIEIFRCMKKLKMRTHTILGNTEISCRMYSNFHEAIAGFSKNVIDFFGGSGPAAIMFAVVTTFGFIPVIIFLPPVHVYLYFIVIVVNRLIISFISRQSPLFNVLLAPLQQISLSLMIISALRKKRRQTLIWKGRNVYQP
jgi:glycosyltransferase involved in cell wall biosynthesis